ncbi:hypothetical protein QI298_09920 [Staphylococcus saprophyticus]|uniref:hypothetical protein n=1 Tax=Staphylococcus saprophyticus TaxID=29385 RepID=UPI0022EA150A|nr:hypothetical protein [Staphylococcus saprophyticus]MDW3983143.1 hypothetical protein [Staphylococcus saprophyticus]
MSEPTKDDLLEFMKKHGPESVDSITDKDSAIKHFRTSSKLYKQQRDQYKTERDTLIDDIAVLKANISRLEQGNKDLRLQSNIYFDELQESEKQRSEFVTMLNESNNFLSEFSHHIGNKPSSSTYKYFRAKLDDLNITEDK